jgi:hypothetical protein
MLAGVATQVEGLEASISENNCVLRFFPDSWAGRSFVMKSVPPVVSYASFGARQVTALHIGVSDVTAWW